MKKWIHYPVIEGETTRQAHCDMPAGTFDREVGREGFFGPATQMHHKHAPTGWIRMEGPLRPRSADINEISNRADSPADAVLLLHNAACKVRTWRCDQAMDHLFRNQDGDDLLFIHEGSGEFFCDYGHFSFRDGDYIVIPRGTMWRIEPTAPIFMMLTEATNDAYQLPEKGAVGQHAIFDAGVLDRPHINDQFKAQQDENEWTIRVKRLNQITEITYPYNPLDCVGWHGDLCVVKLNWRDIRPLMSHRFHLPPSAHTTWVAKRFVVCTFCPRPMETDPGALKLPYFHNNDDYDEVLFYHQGNFFSRDNIRAGMITFHPCGFTHGPHPKAYAAAEGNAGKMTDEVAMMIDTRDPLEHTPAFSQVEDVNYVNSWKPK
ncbi:homogentisate 1,2-dioxygenase [Nitrincola alkalilacustris]|uniref:homogentisate 1,2-dioxygenase n=1 Tax=Nitrincola alkalilacustris TaxID=1571224 RepID=UPI00124F3190|nr:homogentisate 1,2-dioxygenase [Nitrincola alkalilacustris]